MDGLIVIVFVATLLVSVASYVLPSIIALARKVPNVGSVIVVNVLLGWTFVGWVVALAMALRSRPQPMVPVVPAWGPGGSGPAPLPDPQRHPGRQPLSDPGRPELPGPPPARNDR